VLAVFSLPTATSALALRRERYELSRLVRGVAARSKRRVELEGAQYGVTRAKLRDLAKSGAGWDVLHLFGHGGAGEFLLERADGSPDPVSTAELIKLLRPLRPRVKLAVVSACESAAATPAETLRWLGLDDSAAELEAQAAQEAPATPEGVARALVTELGCAVVAMRYPVIDDFAVGFAKELYDRVFRHAQPLDRAVTAAVLAAAGPTPSAARPAISVGTPAIFGASAAGLSLVPPVRKADLGPCRAGDGPVPTGAAAVRRPRRGDGRRPRRPGSGVRAHRGGVPWDGRRGQDRLRAGAGLPPRACHVFCVSQR
jgi:CHAT domain